MSLNVLVIGATRGLGLSIANLYAKSNPKNVVYGTTRSSSAPDSTSSQSINPSINWIPNIDLLKPSVGDVLVNQLGMLGIGGGGRMTEAEKAVKGFDVVIITAGYFKTEEWGHATEEGGLNWDEEVKMYTTSAVAPPIVLHSLHRAHLLTKGSKVLLISSESGSITLRHAVEGGGNYGHHASKAALNMVGKLLSLDLKEDKIIVSIVHPGFMRTDMTKGVGFDKFWDDGGAVTPDVAAKSLVEWVEALDEGKSGEYWAPRGWGDIGTAEKVLGKETAQEKSPAKLPW